MAQPTYEQGKLQLEIFELRREAKLRQARDWFFKNYHFKTFDEAIEQANRLPYGLAAYCFTENGRRALLLGDAIESGMIGINTTMIGGADSPFGGVKDSGHGSEDGPEGLEACMVIKAIHQA